VTPPPPEALAAVMRGLAEAGTVSAKTAPMPTASVIALMMFDLFMRHPPKTACMRFCW
jgi:hypothetical protein